MQYNINVANGTGMEVRTNLNLAHQSLATNFFGATDPSLMSPVCAFPGSTWADTGNGLLKVRNADDSDWIVIGTIESDGTPKLGENAINTSELALNLRRPSTAYAVGDIAYSALLPSWAYLEATVAGTTDSGDLPVPSSVVVGATFTDGTVTWAVCKIENMANYTKTINAPMFNKRDTITTSGTYTAPVTGWYKITVKGGGGGGGAGGTNGTSLKGGGGGGGEGGTTIAYEHMTAGQTASVVIGGGGTKGGTTPSSPATDGGNSTVTVNGNTYTGGGGGAADDHYGGLGGTGTIAGCCGGSPDLTLHAQHPYPAGGQGGGNGGARGAFGLGSSFPSSTPVANSGGGGGGSTYGYDIGSNGADGFAWFEYFDSSLNP